MKSSVFSSHFFDQLIWLWWMNPKMEFPNYDWAGQLVESWNEVKVSRTQGEQSCLSQVRTPQRSYNFCNTLTGDHLKVLFLENIVTLRFQTLQVIDAHMTLWCIFNLPAPCYESSLWIELRCESVGQATPLIATCKSHKNLRETVIWEISIGTTSKSHTE